MSSAVSSFARYTKNLTPGIGRLSDMVIVGGRGSYVWNADKERYLDFATGIGVCNLGHAHPKVVQAVQEQASRMLHAQVNISYHDRMLELMGKLLEVMPTGGNPGPSPLDTFFFWNSGAEAVEAALKLARHATKKTNVIVFKGSYHGRTFGTMGLTTSKTIFSAGFGPFAGGIHVAPFPYCAHCRIGPPVAGSNAAGSCGGGITDCCNEPLQQLELMLKTQVSPQDTAAVLVEPVQGEGGYVAPPRSFLPALRALCDRHGLLLIADEVQTGCGRTGEMWAVDHSPGAIVPDILVFAKGIASGMPLSGIASSATIAATQPPGSMGGTYAGNIVACAAACATLDAIREEGVLANARARGKQLLAGLGALSARFPDAVMDVRGLGLMVGLEFAAPMGSGVAAAVSRACLKRGMILLTTSAFETVRFIPPLNVSEPEVDKALAIVGEAFDEVLAGADKAKEKVA